MNTKNLGTLAALSLAAAAVFLSPTASHALECGDTILPGQKVKLEANVGPCSDQTGGITIIGPATLDLNGFAVTCLLQPNLSQNPTGLRLIGHRAKVMDGRVVACGNGIDLAGEGRHKVMRVETAISGNTGFRVYSPRNVLKDNVAIQNQSHGFEIWGERSVIKKNVSTENGRFGLYVLGESQRIIRNEAIGDGWAGIMAATNPTQGRSRFIRNIALSPDGEHDIELTSDACADIWKGNVFETAGRECLP